MNHKNRPVFTFFYNGILLGAVLTTLMGCGTTAPSRLYTLASLADTDEVTPVVTTAYPLRVQVGPIQLPKYLDRPQIVTRLSPNKIQAAELDRWAEPLQDNMLRVLIENLSHLLKDQHIAVSSWEASVSASYRVAINVSRFDGQLGENVFLMAVWRLFNKEKNQMLLEEKVVITEDCGQPDYASLVSAKSRALANLSREIAENIASLPNDTISDKNP